MPNVNGWEKLVPLARIEFSVTQLSARVLVLVKHAPVEGRRKGIPFFCFWMYLTQDASLKGGCRCKGLFCKEVQCNLVEFVCLLTWRVVCGLFFQQTAARRTSRLSDDIVRNRLVIFWAGTVWDLDNLWQSMRLETGTGNSIPPGIFTSNEGDERYGKKGLVSLLTGYRE